MMKDFRKKVAVITGAASGIGRSLADRCVEEGMQVVLADIEEGALTKAEKELEAAGADVLAVRTDVSKVRDVEALAQQTLDTFGAVHLLFNNAGVGAGTTVWESTLADWEWVMGVNLWGVIYGIRTFVPIMLAQGTEAQIVNTASMAGHIAGPAHGIYKVSKFGVVTLSETLHHELALQGAKVRVSLLCPGWVNTNILNCGRNRPAELQNDPGSASLLTSEQTTVTKTLRQLVTGGLSPEVVASRVFDAIRAEQFYIFTHPDMNDLIRQRMDKILNGRNP
jgi:NAD(P)-dependent dehydrogenase (short-subunit alcohol dehydrogenase family)